MDGYGSFFGLFVLLLSSSILTMTTPDDEFRPILRHISTERSSESERERCHTKLAVHNSKSICGLARAVLLRTNNQTNVILNEKKKKKKKHKIHPLETSICEKKSIIFNFAPENNLLILELL